MIAALSCARTPAAPQARATITAAAATAFLILFSAFVHSIPVATGTVQVIATWITETIKTARAAHRSNDVVTGKLSGRAWGLS
jgi:hypothetical protein